MALRQEIRRFTRPCKRSKYSHQFRCASTDSPDQDPAPEIYETPELTDDVSTIQTGTLRSASPTPSEEDRHGPDMRLDRQRIDRDEARRRFDRAVVDARDVDFSDRLGVDRKSYKISSRRRRHRQRTTSDTDGSNDSDEESLPSRLARLRREAEELRIELEQRENEDHAPDAPGVEEEFSKLNMTLDGLRAPRRQRTVGQPLPAQHTPDRAEEDAQALPPESQLSTITAVSTFSDRLTSLEAALGLSTTLATASNTPTSILPTLTHLSTQITTLTSTLSTSRSPSSSSSSIPNLDDLSTRVRALISETDKLTLSRKAALQSLSDLQEARLRNADSVPYGHSRHLSTQSAALAGEQQQSSSSTTQQQQQQKKTESKLFLSEQAGKISALYELLPTIQSLHPLLPTVLDRLRSLQVVHAGAAEARADLEEIESRQARMEEELKKWREGLDAVERGMKDHEQTGRGNMEVVRQMVEDLEGRLRDASR